jgi:hypothetical protein
LAGQTPTPPLTTAKDLGLKGTKAQGVVCEAVTQMNSAFRDPFVIFVANFEIPYQFREKSEKYKLKFVGFLVLGSTTFLL